jgi:hypothetical protein
VKSEDAPRFTEADMGLLLAPSQATLRTLYSRAHEIAPDFNRVDGGMTGVSMPSDLDEGAMSSLSVDVHIVPRLDPKSGLRHGMTLTTEDFLGADEPTTTTYEIWWKEDRKVEGFAYYELRNGDGTPCTEENAQALLRLLPDPTDASTESHAQEPVDPRVLREEMYRAFGVLGLYQRGIL